MYSVKKIMKVSDERYDHLQNKMESLKRMVKAEENHHAELQSEMCSVQIMMLKAEEMRCAYFQSEIDSTKNTMKGPSSMPAEQTSNDLASMVFLSKLGHSGKKDI
jgi:hypothetical protein